MASYGFSLSPAIGDKLLNEPYDEKAEGLNLDFETRGVISASIDNAFEKQNILERVGWILEADELAVRSREDLVVGYVMGALMSTAYDIVRHRKLIERLDKLNRRRLREVHGKEKTAEIMHEQDVILEKAMAKVRTKGGRRLKTELTEEETDDIRNMLVPMIPCFREKIRKELALGRI